MSDKGMSLCTCDHVGDVRLSPNTGPERVYLRNQHLGLLGHGACAVKGCPCEKFTWKRHLTAMDRIEEGKEELT